MLDGAAGYRCRCVVSRRQCGDRQATPPTWTSTPRARRHQAGREGRCPARMRGVTQRRRIWEGRGRHTDDRTAAGAGAAPEGIARAADYPSPSSCASDWGRRDRHIGAVDAFPLLREGCDGSSAGRLPRGARVDARPSQDERESSSGFESYFSFSFFRFFFPPFLLFFFPPNDSLLFYSRFSPFFFPSFPSFLSVVFFSFFFLMSSTFFFLWSFAFSISGE